MAAVAKTPAPSDGRFPCPQCGGLVHPIAGKCKHCKADLAAARGARPAAAAALPALAAGGKAAPAPKADPTPAPAPSPVRAIAQAAAEAAPILPPRPTGRMQAAKSPKGSLLRNWPVIVIILAGIAIAAAVVLMVWPPSGTAKADTRLPPPPAPERMDTNPLPPQGSLTAPKVVPGAPTQPDPWAKPDPDDQANNIDPVDPLKDPFANPRGGNSNPFGNVTGTAAVTFSVLQHACSRMTSCGNSQLAPFCSSMGQMFGAIGTLPPPTCAAAQRCIDRIDQLDCNASLSSQADILSAAGTIQDCSDAMTRC
jgi:hypothetical protein